MITLQQLQCFVVSGDVGSFSEAADVLYTTQSNVSRMISAMEKEIGYPLFKRSAHGIQLNEKGKQLYEHASKVLADMESLEEAAKVRETNQLCIASNPGSWFARTFTDFYIEHEKDHWHYLVHTGSTDEVLKRTENGLAEIGFLYIFKEEWSAFQYHLKRSGLIFTPLKKVQGMLYYTEDGDPLSKPYVQMEQDAFTAQKEWHFVTGEVLHTQPTAVVTNSDYIMRMLLDRADVANISAESFYNQKGIPLDNQRGNAMYGYVQLENHPFTKMAEQFLAYLKSRLSG